MKRSKASKQVKEQEDKEVCDRCDMDVNECECWELDAIEEMMREEW